MKRNIIGKAVPTVILLVLLCAAFLILPVAGEESTESLNIAYCNLSFENETHLLYAVPSSDENLRLLIWNGPQDTYTYGTQTAELEPYMQNVNIGGVPHTVFKYTGLAAKNMTDDVYARAYIDGENYGKVDKYSILQYALNKLGKTGTATTNESLKNLLSSMLTMGADAQVYANYKTDRLANGNWVMVSLDGGTLPDGFSYGLYLPGDAVELNAPKTNVGGESFLHWKEKTKGAVSLSATLTISVGSANQSYQAVYGQPYSQGVEFTTNDDGTCSVSGIGSCTDSDVRIPPISSEGDRVTIIYSYAFQNCSSLTSITIPDSVTSIGDYAFRDCRSLTSITIPDSVTRIYSYAFQNCSSLTSITIPEGVTSIGYEAFYGCSSLTSITIPASVTSIGGSAFQNCSSLTSITIPDSVTSIDDSAFSGCSSLTSITIPDSVTSIGRKAFYGCNSLIQKENGVSYVDKWIIDCDRSVSNVTLRSNTIGIGDDAFSDCISLTSITIPEGVTSIDAWAFGGCSSLTSITIPASVTSIGNHAFSDCNSLIQKENGVSYVDKWIIDCDESVSNVTLRSNTVGIGDHAFSDCISLTSVTIGDGVTSIGVGAFDGCSSLTSITIPEGVTSIGDDAFRDCSSLTSITIPAGVTSIGYAAFLNCSSLTSITIPDSVTSIGVCAFSDCSSLMSITIGDSVTSIGARAFQNCSSLTSVYITDIAAWCNIGFGSSDANPLCYADNLYLDGELITELVIPAGVTSIGGSAFQNCSSLTSITIPDSVTSIDDSAFSGCSSLTSITIPDSVTSIGHHAFYSCDNLTSITIPDSVTSIGDVAFYECRSLTSITFQGTKAQWEAIEKGYKWDEGSPTYTIHCTDGDRTKS